MKIILHLGAQRTATTTFQHYMRRHKKALAKEGIGFWGPLRTRHSGLFEGLFVSADSEAKPEDIECARARVARAFDASAERGLKALVISDENLLGSAKNNLKTAELYPTAKQRLGAFAQALEGRVSTVMLGVRALDDYWSSTIPYAVKRGAGLPGHSKLEAITNANRSWRDVIEDVADVFEASKLEVHCHEAFASYPNKRIARAVDAQNLPENMPNLWLNEAPDLAELRAILQRRGAKSLPEGTGRYQPFDARQRASLKEDYADDMFWLAAQGRKLATYVENNPSEETGISLSLATERGHDYDKARGMDRAS